MTIFYNGCLSYFKCSVASSDVDYNILNIRVCSGSTNDRFAWGHSEVRQEMLRLRNDPEILGQEGAYYFIGIMKITFILPKLRNRRLPNVHNLPSKSDSLVAQKHVQLL